MNAVKGPTQYTKPRPRLVPPAPKKPATRNIPWKRVATGVVLAIGFFSIGMIPMWLRARQYGEQREAAQRELRLKQVQAQLATAVINADRGEYEPARQIASDFFSSLRSQIDRGPDSDLSPFQRDKVKVLLLQRDEIITLLARSDPAAVDRLWNIYVAYQKAMKDVGGTATST